MSVDDILTTSGTIPTPPLEPETIMATHSQELENHDTVPSVEKADQNDVQIATDTDSEETKVIEIPTLNEDTVNEKEEENQQPPEGATGGEKTQETSPADLVNQIMHTAVRAANKAAANAYTTAKEVFYTWQARTYQTGKDYKPPNAAWKPKETSFKPPKSDWKPKENENTETAWKSTNEKYKPPKSEWKPTEDKWLPPKEIGPMGKLQEMGFCNRELNIKLLKKHNDDVEAVVQEILATNENNWMEQRHG